MNFVIFLRTPFLIEHIWWLLLWIKSMYISKCNHWNIESVALKASPASHYMFKVNNTNNRTRCEICLKLTVKTPEQRRTGNCRLEASQRLRRSSQNPTRERPQLSYEPSVAVKSSERTNKFAINLEILQHTWIQTLKCRIMFCQSENDPSWFKACVRYFLSIFYF